MKEDNDRRYSTFSRLYYNCFDLCISIICSYLVSDFLWCFTSISSLTTWYGLPKRFFFLFAFYNSPRDCETSLSLCNLHPNPTKPLFRLLSMFLRMLKNKTKNPAALRNSKFVWKYLKIFLQGIILAFLQIWLSSFITNTSAAAIFHSSMRSLNVLTNTMGISTYSKQLVSYISFLRPLLLNYFYKVAFHFLYWWIWGHEFGFQNHQSSLQWLFLFKHGTHFCATLPFYSELSYLKNASNTKISIF